MMTSRVKNDHTFRPALTHFKTIKQMKEHALVQIFPVTGRTHQIRVHLAAIGHPLLGDELYGMRSELIQRHALHATSISFIFGERLINVSVCLPLDMQNFFHESFFYLNALLV
jgi:23S rRNA pseudouridine1911/1915/1917 synthase